MDYRTSVWAPPPCVIHTPHSADSSNELPDLHTTPIRACEVHAPMATISPTIPIKVLKIHGSKHNRGIFKILYIFYTSEHLNNDCNFNYL